MKQKRPDTSWRRAFINKSEKQSLLPHLDWWVSNLLLYRNIQDWPSMNLQRIY